MKIIEEVIKTIKDNPKVSNSRDVVIGEFRSKELRLHRRCKVNENNLLPGLEVWVMYDKTNVYYLDNLDSAEVHFITKEFLVIDDMLFEKEKQNQLKAKKEFQKLFIDNLK